MKNKKRVGIVAIICAAVLAVGVLIYLLSGDETGPGRVAPEPSDIRDDAKTARVVVKTATEWYDAVGTVEPRTQARIEPQVAAQVVAVSVNAGDRVARGQILVRLDDRRLNAQLSQARQSLKSAIAGKEQASQAVNSAEAGFVEAKSAYDRVRNYFDARAATEQELEQARSRFLQAEAALKRAKDGLTGASAGIGLAEDMIHEAEIALEYTEIRAPSDGEVLKRLVDPGDMALPGKPVLLLKTSNDLRLAAYVRESLINRIKPGWTLKVELSTLGKTVDAEVEEIVPYADPQTRSFLVKAALPPIEGVYPGMYGKLLIPYQEVQVVLAPKKAIETVGQLELVRVRDAEGWQRRYIKTGNTYNGRVEVLSGLSGGETVLVMEQGEHDE